MSRTVQPPRTVRLSAYYDATKKDNENDYGTFIALCGEDHHFTTSARSVALARMRREIRNNPYLAGIVNKFPEALGFSNLRSRTSSSKYNAAKDVFWYRWKKSVTNAGDSLRTIEEIVVRELLIAGEAFKVLLANGKIQLIPSEFCGSPIGAAEKSGGREFNGIVYGDDGQPTHYRFGSMKPGGAISYAESDSTLVPAKFVIHIFHKDRVMMGRGLPWLIPSLRPAHDLYEITRAKVKQIKDANSITGTLEREGASTGNGLGGLRGDGAGGADVEPEDPNAPADKVNKDPVIIELKPGTFVGLEPGEKLNMLKTEYEATDYKELIFIMLHAISTPVGLPVELWFSGLGDVNYSGFKGLGTQWNARRTYLLAFLEDRYLDRLHVWRIGKAANEGDLPANPDGDDDLIEWAWRRTAVLDEEKEAKANSTKIASGQESLIDVWEREGKYAEEVLAARREFWIKLCIAAGELEEGADHSKVKVPKGFLLRGELPGELTYPRLPGGFGETENQDPSAAPAPAPSDAEKKKAEQRTAAFAERVADIVFVRLESLLEERLAA